jgi:hypothetical protein
VHGLLELWLDKRMRIGAVTLVHIIQFNCSVALRRDEAGWACRLDHANGWRQTVKPLATGEQALYALFGSKAHDRCGRELIAAAQCEGAAS